MATHSSIRAWKGPWTEEPGGLQSMGLHDWACVHEGGGRWVSSNKMVELKKKKVVSSSPHLTLWVVHKWTGNVGPTLGLELKGSGWMWALEEQLGPKKLLPPTCQVAWMPSKTGWRDLPRCLLSSITSSFPREEENCFHSSVTLNVLDLIRPQVSLGLLVPTTLTF